MSITTQTLFIARKSKQEQLSEALTHLKTFSLNISGCLAFEVFQCDEEDKEFLVYEQWCDQNSLDNFKKSDIYKLFLKQKETLVYRTEVLNLM